MFTSVSRLRCEQKLFKTQQAISSFIRFVCTTGVWNDCKFQEGVAREEKQNKIQMSLADKIFSGLIWFGKFYGTSSTLFNLLYGVAVNVKKLMSGNH